MVRERILVIDDDAETCETIASLVGRQGFACDTAQRLASGLALVREGRYDVVFLDVILPDGNGISILPEVMEQADPPEVIILTGKGDPDGAELAIREGAWDYLLKPSSVREITLSLKRALRYHKEKQARRPELGLDFGSICGRSREIRECLRRVAQAAQSESGVLITGETGTGKELFARTIHRNSARADGRFVAVDCAALTESLVESTLFGHRRGAYTGAQTDRDGLVRLADGGTLFLDEIGEMPLSLQKVFLRVLQEKRFRPLGSTVELTSDFRLIAATNRDLAAMVDAGTFRSDLLFRIKTMRIHLPPLRQRKEDIDGLVRFTLERQAKLHHGEPRTCDDDFLTILHGYDWPGNVRELFHVLERSALEAGREQTLCAMHLPRELRIHAAKRQILRQGVGGGGDPGVVPVRKTGQEPGPALLTDGDLPPFKAFKHAAERQYLQTLIERAGGDLAAMLAISGLSRSHLYSLVKKYGLQF